MSIIRVTKEFRFEGAHALTGYDGKCRHIHGHSYSLFVTLKGSPKGDSTHPKSGMVLDFSELKSLVNELIIEPFDHALILRKDAKLATEIERDYCNVIITDFQPTCENLAIYFADIIKNRLPDHLKLSGLKLYETPTSFVEWVADDNQ
ncbi:MAG: 6-carboxytetrahydropterin synthase [Bacteroidales bacterium]|jgi:6-pyruvoyltetrahydropterin/6-carboxytetrahydropterin synthase|nr:6-carboxytetrahydropterin synthase [Bacteroidales bacterium]